MSIIYSTVSNEKYTVSCMGKMVYIYEKAGRELGRFNFDGAEFAVISSDGDTFAVKAKDGGIALYSFSQLAKTAVLKQPADEDCFEKGMCFSSDGKKIFDAEKNAICVFDVRNGECEKFTFDNAVISHVECANEIFVLGKEAEKGFVAKLNDGKLCDIKYISDKDYEYYFNYKCAENKGFSSAAMERYLPDVSKVEYIRTSLCELWNKKEG